MSDDKFIATVTALTIIFIIYKINPSKVTARYGDYEFTAEK